MLGGGNLRRGVVQIYREITDLVGRHLAERAGMTPLMIWALSVALFPLLPVAGYNRRD
jgi:hypothetical protein